MIKQLLVPLDGSHLAETVLPVASFMAEKLGASVALLHLIEHNPPAKVHGDRHLTTTQEAEAYLSGLAQSAFPKSVPVEWHVHTVEVINVPLSIVEHSGEMGSHLVILCTHGHTGLRDLLVGSIAQRVISEGRTPVLLIPPTVDETAGFQCKKVMVALDTKAEHEQGLPLAAEIAQACGGSLHLVTVVPTLETLSGEEASAGKLLPTAMSELLNQTEEEALANLAGLVEAQAGEGITASAEVRRGEPVGALLAAAADAGADLLVLTTHGHKGPVAFWSGSVAPKVILRAKTPLLLVRAR